MEFVKFLKIKVDCFGYAAGLCALLFLLVSPTVSATYYYYTDDDGNAYFGNTIPPESARFGNKKLNQQGVITSETKKEKTDDELRAEALVKISRAQLEDSMAAERKKNLVLLQSYQSEVEIELALQHKLKAIETIEATTKRTVVRYDEQLTDLQGQAASYERRGQDIPEWLVKNIIKIEGWIKQKHHYLSEKQQQKLGLRAKFQEDLIRFRAIKAQQASSAVP